MKMRHKHWRNRAYNYLREQGRGMTANEILSNTKSRYGPNNPCHAAQLLRVDKRFFSYPAPASVQRAGERQVLMYEVYPDE
tara:strand:+ start:112 stop:354 length:243 start_codon:yes stop_codon:yes gene_type:complete